MSFAMDDRYFSGKWAAWKSLIMNVLLVVSEFFEVRSSLSLHIYMY